MTALYLIATVLYLSAMVERLVGGVNEVLFKRLTIAYTVGTVIFGVWTIWERTIGQ